MKMQFTKIIISTNDFTKVIRDRLPDPKGALLLSLAIPATAYLHLSAAFPSSLFQT